MDEPDQNCDDDDNIPVWRSFDSSASSESSFSTPAASCLPYKKRKCSITKSDTHEKKTIDNSAKKRPRSEELAIPSTSTAAQGQGGSSNLITDSEKKRRRTSSNGVSIQSTSTADQLPPSLPGGKGRLSNLVPSIIYQIRLLMLFFLRGTIQGYSFKLRTEMFKYGQLDDIVFEYCGPKGNSRNGVIYVQAKYSEKIENIKFNDLLLENDKLLGLLKFFKSFIGIPESLKTKGKSTQIILCSNIELHEELKQYMDEVPEEDDILNNNVAVKRYKFKTEKQTDDRKKTDVNTKFLRKEEIVRILSKVTQMDKLANQLAKDLSTDRINSSMYTIFHSWLGNNIFELPKKIEKQEAEKKKNLDTKKEYYVQFRDTFFEDVELKTFRDELQEAVNPTKCKLDSLKNTIVLVVKNFCCEPAKNTCKEPKDFKQLAKDLAEPLCNGNKLSIKKFKANLVWLMTNVFESPCIKLKKDFLINNSTDDKVKQFHQLIQDYLKNNGNYPLEKFENKKFFVQKDFFSDPSESDQTPDNSIRIDLIEKFLQNVIIIQTCNKKKLREEINVQLGNELHLIGSQLMGSSLEDRMYDFLIDKKTEFITQDDFQQFLKDSIITLNRFASIGLTEQRQMKIKKYACRFSEEGRTVKELMNPDKQVIIISQNNALLTEMKIHQVFEGKGKDAYIVENLKNAIESGNVLEAFRSEEKSCLIIINDGEICDRSLFFDEVNKILKENEKKQFILIKKQYEKICDIFDDYKVFDDVDDSFSDLTSQTQEELLKKIVTFQGRKIAFGMLITDENLKSYIKGDILLKLITDSEKIIIGDAPLHQSNLDRYEEIEKFYIPRLLFRKTSENGDGIINNITIDDFRKFSKKYVLISASPGMGKSTLLTYLTSIISKSDQVTWVVRINLKDYKNDFSDISNDFEQKNIQSEAKKILYKILKLTGKDELKILEKEIFKKMFDKNEVVLLLDGFDDINKDDQKWSNNIISWVQCMAKMKKIFITTRQYTILTILESKLGVDSYQIKPMDVQEQKDFVERFWRNLLQQSGNNITDEKKNEINDYINKGRVIEIFEKSVKSLSTLFETPLYIRMAAEIWLHKFIDDPKFEINNVSLISLYKSFIETRFYKISHEMKFPINGKTKVMYEKELKRVIQFHQNLALSEIIEIYGPKFAKMLMSKKEIEETRSTCDSGIDIGLYKVVNNARRLVHETFEEYLQAARLFYMLKKYKNQDIKLNTERFHLLKNLQYILTVKDGLTFFFNCFLIEGIDSDINRGLFNRLLKGDLKVLDDENFGQLRDSYDRTPLHLTCAYTDIRDFISIFKTNEEALTSIDKLFGWTPLHYSIMYHQFNAELDTNLCTTLNKFISKDFKELLLSKKFNLNQKDYFGQTLLMLSIRYECREKCFHKLLKSLDEKIDEMDSTCTDIFGKSNFTHYLDSLLNKKDPEGEETDLCLGQEYIKENWTVLIGLGLLGSLHSKLNDNCDFDVHVKKIINACGEDRTKEWIDRFKSPGNRTWSKLYWKYRHDILQKSQSLRDLTQRPPAPDSAVEEAVN